jgi:hypothetical protein
MAGPVVNAPIVLDVGRTSRRNIRQLSQGCGKLTGEVQDALTDVTASLGDEAEGKQLVPVILVYRKKSRRRRGKGRGRGWGGLFPPFF